MADEKDLKAAGAGQDAKADQDENKVSVETKNVGGIQVRTYRADENSTVFHVKSEAEMERDIAAYEARENAKIDADFEKRKEEMRQRFINDQKRAKEILMGKDPSAEKRLAGDAGAGEWVVGSTADDSDNMNLSEITPEEAAAAIMLEPEKIEARLKEIVKDDRIVCIGDSITYGHQVDGMQTWIGRLRKECEINLLNVGVDGDTTGNMLARFKPHVLDLKPMAVLIMGGGNDIFGETPLDYVTNNIAMMCQQALENGIVPMVGVEPEPDHKRVPKEWKQFIDYDKCCEQLMILKEWILMFGKANNLPVFDFDSGMKNKLRAGYSRYFFDGAHPNPAGHKIMADIAKEKFQELGILPPDKEVKMERFDKFEL